MLRIQLHIRMYRVSHSPEDPNAILLWSGTRLDAYQVKRETVPLQEFKEMTDQEIRTR